MESLIVTSNANAPCKTSLLSETYTEYLGDTDQEIKKLILKFFNDHYLKHDITGFVKQYGPGVLNGRYSMSSGPTTALEHWVSQGNLEFVKKLVEAGARDCVYFADKKVYTSALRRAARGGHTEIVQYLLNQGARGNFMFDDTGGSKRSLLFLLVLEIKEFYGRTQKETSVSKPLECLEIILKHLESSNPESLQDLLHSKNEPYGTLIELAESVNFSKLRDLIKSFMFEDVV